MRNVPTKVLLALAVATPLGGCSSFLGIKLSRHTPRAAPEVRVAATGAVAAVPAAAATATEAGRAHLAVGRTGLALEAFQQALGAGEPKAPALNGLGVAYARMGRFDLAQRFFGEAAAADPADPRYAENLARLMRSPALALRRDGDIAAAALKTQPALPMRTSEAALAEGKLERVSRGEVRIRTASPHAAPLNSRNAEVERRFKPIVRIALAGAQPEPFKPLVRVELPAPNSDAATAAEAAPAR